MKVFFKFQFDSLLAMKGFPGKFWEMHQNGVFWAYFEVLINLNWHFHNWKFIYQKKNVSRYFDFLFQKKSCISIWQETLFKCALLLNVV